MAKNDFRLGLVAMVLVFGMAVVGCATFSPEAVRQGKFFSPNYNRYDSSKQDGSK
jgi:hypothetical protein